MSTTCRDSAGKRLAAQPQGEAVQVAVGQNQISLKSFTVSIPATENNMAAQIRTDRKRWHAVAVPAPVRSNWPVSRQLMARIKLK